jgi:hypothetical protein
MTLKEARKLATPGPLVVEILPAIKGHDEAMALTGEGGGGDVVAWIEDNNKYNAALLEHCRNHFDEVVKFIERCATETDGLMFRYRKSGALFHDAIADEARAILAHANEVKT